MLNCKTDDGFGLFLIANTVPRFLVLTLVKCRRVRVFTRCVIDGDHINTLYMLSWDQGLR